MAFDIGSVIAKIDADITGFKKGIADAQSETSKLGKTLGGIGENVADFGKKAAIMTGIVGAGLGVLAKSGIDAAAKFEQYEIAFTTLLKDRQKAQQAILNIQEDAKKTPFQMPELIRGNQLLISAGVSAEQARKDIINLGNAISATGGGSDELNRLSVNLQQIQAVGKASALDVKQFAFAGINVYKLLADSTGKNVEQVKAMDITYEDLSKAFEKASSKGGLFEDAMSKQSRTLNGLMSTLKDTISIGLKDVIVKSGLFDVIRSGIENLIPFLENTAVPAITRFFAVLGGGFQLLGSLIRGENVLPEVREFISYFTGGEMPDENHPAVRFFIGFADIIKNIGEWIKNNQETVLAFLKGLAIGFGALLIIGTITALITALANPLVLIALLIAALYTAWQTNFLGIRDIAQQVIDTIKWLIENILMPVFQAFKDWFSNVLAPAIVAVWQGFIMPLFQAFVGWFKERWEYIKEIINGVWNIIKGIVQVAWAIVSGIITVGLQVITGNWSGAWETIKKKTSDVWDGLKNIFNGAIDFIKGWGGMVVHNLVQPFEDAWNKIKEFVQKIKDNLDFTKKHSPSVVDIVNKGVNEVNKALQGLEYGFNVTPQLAGAAITNAPMGGNVTQVKVDMAGAIIADEYSASRMGEIIGDSIINKLKVNVRF